MSVRSWLADARRAAWWPDPLKAPHMRVMLEDNPFAKEAFAALEAVIDLHRPLSPNEATSCIECSREAEWGVEWPCPTIEAIARVVVTSP